MVLLDFENIYNVEKNPYEDDEYCCCDEDGSNDCAKDPSTLNDCSERECETQFHVIVSPCQAPKSSWQCSMNTDGTIDSQSLVGEYGLFFQFTTIEQPRKVQFVHD